jgi:hypothetical protein
MSNNYSNKYLKYKNKYLELNNKLIGGYNKFKILKMDGELILELDKGLNLADTIQRIAIKLNTPWFKLVVNNKIINMFEDAEKIMSSILDSNNVVYCILVKDINFSEIDASKLHYIYTKLFLYQNKYFSNIIDKYLDSLHLEINNNLTVNDINIIDINRQLNDQINNQDYNDDDLYA